MAAENALKTKKKYSKNKKTYWKKHVDIRDVEAHLEDKRRDERLGLESLSTKPDNKIFKIDTSSAVKTKQKTNKQTIKKVKSLKEKRLALRAKPLKSFSILISKSKVQDPIKRNRVKSADEKKSSLSLVEEKRRKLTSKKYKHALAQRLAFKENLDLSQQLKSKLPTVQDDLWGTSDSTQEFWGVQEFHDLVTKKKIPNRPKTLFSKPSQLKAIPSPHPGISYNPRLEDYNQLLSEVCNVQIDKDKVAQSIEAKTTECYPTKEEAPTKESIMKEMCQGLGMSSDESCDEDNPDDMDQENNMLPNPPINDINRKTRKSRRKEREMRLAAQKRLAEKENAVKQAEVFRMKNIQTELKKLDYKKKARAYLKRKKEKLKTVQPHKLSRYDFIEPDQEINHPSDIVGNLRNIKVEGHLMEDRYYSLQKRNIIETRIPQKKQKRKFRLKKYIKRSHKE